MNSDTEGMLIASSCMALSTISQMQIKGLLSPQDVSDLIDRAEMMLAGLSPSLMSAEARDYARRVLQDAVTQYPPQREN